MSTTKTLFVKPIPNRIARKIIIDNHYSKRFPASIICFGIFKEERLLGVCCYGTGNSQWHKRLVKGTVNGEYFELTRLWVDDELGKNTESRFISLTLRLIKKNLPHVKWVISFSDLNQGHEGSIYRATNFLYIGLGGFDSEVYNEATGIKINNRTLSSLKFGVKEQKEMGFKKIPSKGKNKYIYFIKPEEKKNLQVTVKEYVRAESKDSVAANFQLAEDGASPISAHKEELIGL